MLPAHFVNMYGGAQLGQCFSQDSGMVSNVKALEKLDLCRTTSVKQEKTSQPKENLKGIINFETHNK